MHAPLQTMLPLIVASAAPARDWPSISGVALLKAARIAKTSRQTPNCVFMIPPGETPQNTTIRSILMCVCAQESDGGCEVGAHGSTVGIGSTVVAGLGGCLNLFATCSDFNCEV